MRKHIYIAPRQQSNLRKKQSLYVSVGTRLCTAFSGLLADGEALQD
jgi:hypothetical protein